MNQECPICFHKVSYISIKCGYCNNSFHTECVNKWILINNSCPLCRCKNPNTNIKVFGPKPDNNFIYWANRTINIKEIRLEIEEYFKKDDKDDVIIFKPIDIELCQRKASMFTKLMIKKYGPRIAYNN